MQIMEVIEHRRNIKHFRPDPIDLSEVLQWLQSAAFAPNHRMTEPWEVWFIGPQTRAELSHKRNFGDAPIVFALLSPPTRTTLERDEQLVAAGCFLENFCLAATAAGAGTGWSSLGASHRNREILGVPDGYDVVTIISVGYPAEVPEAKPRTPIEDKIKQLP